MLTLFSKTESKLAFDGLMVPKLKQATNTKKHVILNI